MSKLIREGDINVKLDFEQLIRGGSVKTEIDEQIIFNQLDNNKNAIWSLLLASGYLKVVDAVDSVDERRKPTYTLSITNKEVEYMFYNMVEDWFSKDCAFSDFVSAMLRGDEKGMNRHMNKIALNTFSYFDAGNKPSKQCESERFYHGFVLGLIVEKAGDYMVKSNRESGYGRYDVVMEQKDAKDVAVIIEFKVFDEEDGEETLENTAKNALLQIE